MIEEFERHLRGTNLSENTISSYLFAIRQYSSQYDGITKKNLRAYKVWLIENYKPKTVNLRLRAINCYLESIGKESWKMPFVRVQQKAFLENVISEADYEYFKTCLKRDDELFWYFVIRFLAATGARVSELIQIKVEHIKLGHLDLYSKGGKLRRIYIPKALQNEALSWLNDKHQESGFIFLNKYGDRITTRGISGQLKKLAVRYGIDPVVIYPHSFRHRFAKSFLDRCNDIAFLADLTIIDYNDALTLTGYIGSNLAKTQMYNPDNGSYTPDWKTKNLVLTPSLYVIGTTADQIATANVTSVKWYVGDSNTAITAGTNYALSGAKSHILTVKANVMAELPGIDYRCVITYKDESTGLSLTHPLTISFSRVVNGSGIVDLLVTTPNGNVFKNEEVASLTAKAELWRGSTVDTTKVSYKWAVMDASVTATSSTDYDADFGIGWRKLSDTADKYTGTATNTLTVYAAAVDSYAVFKCCAQDTDSASVSYNTKFFDVATFIDNSDPLQIIVTSTGGDVFKNGQGTTVLTAVCYQAGSEVDAAGNGSYTWTKYNKDGVVDTSWGTNGSKTGKTLSVSSADVDTKATFMVVVAL